jgi:FkbH-like protein
MFQTDWANAALWQNEVAAQPFGERLLHRQQVDKVMLLHWQEHCIECAVPQCYSTCALYVARADKKCARFVYGIQPNANFEGLLDFGADIRFRRWGKLETVLSDRVAGPDQVLWMSRLDAGVTKAVSAASKLLVQLSPQRRLHGTLGLARDHWLSGGAPVDNVFDHFVLECYSPEPTNFHLIFEHWDDKLRYRCAFDIYPGLNCYGLPAKTLGPGRLSGKLLLYPENDLECRVIFTWLDLVKLKKGQSIQLPAVGHKRPKPSKLKCIVWDLDNTLWTGILSEETNGVNLRADAKALIEEFDRRGLLQSVVSKNNFNEAWNLISTLGLEGYFLYPEINWDPKSANMVRIAANLNIGTDTLALIDDSDFEKAEVRSAHPEIRTYSADNLTALLDLSDFDVPVTDFSSARRLSYFTEMKRDREREAFPDYEEFLRSCDMALRIFVPDEPAIRYRCFELMQRANQLNLSGRRRTEQEIKTLFETPGVLCLALDCKDKYGAYGTVGFAIVDEREESPVLRDFVLSCRVAQKRVERTFIEWLAVREFGLGHRLLRAEFVETERNAPMRSALDCLPFRLSKEDGKQAFLELQLDGAIRVGGILTLQSALTDANLQARGSW